MQLPLLVPPSSSARLSLADQHPALSRFATVFELEVEKGRNAQVYYALEHGFQFRTEPVATLVEIRRRVEL